ncbi:LysR family transcriptional regulator [Cupriavidus sp. WKF15]|uniref:LysR family transcriptional regulator n=1 Tax=Cupriavidus sp. WKF15 TaxID=3032282 RepID=UPI0023E26CD7|nr:LysR family transcriptional regulator [Cupriavidus sp. WKF15]WER44649.1 LysR family transcriptional regulator [Cupriavidus sp. WKF15]
MELRHLRYFIAVAEHESIRLAAEHIHVTQPAISRQIHDMEEELGFPLFSRTPRGLKLTTAGQAYLREARAALARLDVAARAAQRISAGVQGYLRLGFVENSGWDGIVPHVFRRFQAEVPDVRIELVPMNTPQQLDALRDGMLDGGFIYQYGPLDSSLAALPLATNNVVLAAPHAWTLPGDDGSRHPTVTLRDIADWPFITFPRAVYPLYYDRLIGACQALGVTLDVVQEVSTEAAVLSLVCAGIGAAIVNSANLGRPPALVRFASFSDLAIPMPLVFVHPANALEPALARFIETVRVMIAMP